MASRPIGFLLVFLVLLLPACGSKEILGVDSEVTGTVRVNGAPLPGGTATIYFTSPQTKSSATIKSDGTYRVVNLSPDKYKVHIAPIDPTALRAGKTKTK